MINAEFAIVTDHISLTYLQNLRSGPSKLARASVQLSQFKFKIKHLAGKKNSAADAISRTKDLPTDPLTALAKDRHEDDNIIDLQTEMTDRNDDKIGNSDFNNATHDVGIQCERLKIIRTFNENDDWPVMTIRDWNIQPSLPQRRARVRSADCADERSGQVPAGERTPSGSSAGAAASAREAAECTAVLSLIHI